MAWLAIQPVAATAGAPLAVAAAAGTPAAPTPDLPALAEWALQFTPHVSTADDGVLLDLTGCTGLFGGLDALLARIGDGLAAQGIDARLGLGHTPRAAQRFAWHGLETRAAFDADGTPDPQALRRLLATLPLAGPGLTADATQALQRMGFATLGDLLALPRPALDRRLGAATGRWLEQLTGARADPRQAIVPVATFALARDFIDVVTHTAFLARPLQDMLTEFTCFLRQRQRVTQRIDWLFRHSDRTHSELPVITTRPEHDGHRLSALTRVALENFRIAAPIEGVSLHCRQLLPLATLPASLFPELAGQHQRDDTVLALLDRLRTRLGNDACRQWQAVDRHRPEQGARPVPAGHIAAATTGSTGPADPCADGRGTGNTARDGGTLATPPRPCWLLPAPQPVRLQQHGGSRTLHWHGGLALLGSVERIAADWWTATPCRRDYHVARRDDGVLLWLFRDHADGRWYVHGIFG